MTERDSDAGFRQLCETCGVGFWHIDNRGHTVYLNATMASMLELDSPAEIGDATFHEFFTGPSLERREREERIRHADGDDTDGRRGPKPAQQ